MDVAGMLTGSMSAKGSFAKFAKCDTQKLLASDEEARSWVKTRGYVYCSLSRPPDDAEMSILRSQPNEVLRKWADDQLSKSEVKSALDHFKLAGSIPVVDSHNHNGPDQKLLMPGGLPHRTVGKVVQRTLLPNSSVIDVVRYFDTPEGLQQCRRVESGMQLGVSMNTMRTRDTGKTANLDLSPCVEGKRPRTGLIGIIDYGEERPVEGTSEIFHKLADEDGSISKHLGLDPASAAAKESAKPAVPSRWTDLTDEDLDDLERAIRKPSRWPVWGDLDGDDENFAESKAKTAKNEKDDKTAETSSVIFSEAAETRQAMDLDLFVSLRRSLDPRDLRTMATDSSKMPSFDATAAQGDAQGVKRVATGEPQGEPAAKRQKAENGGIGMDLDKMGSFINDTERKLKASGDMLSPEDVRQLTSMLSEGRTVLMQLGNAQSVRKVEQSTPQETEKERELKRKLSALASTVQTLVDHATRQSPSVKKKVGNMHCVPIEKCASLEEYVERNSAVLSACAAGYELESEVETLLKEGREQRAAAKAAAAAKSVPAAPAVSTPTPASVATPQGLSADTLADFEAAAAKFGLVIVKSGVGAGSGSSSVPAAAGAGAGAGSGSGIPAQMATGGAAPIAPVAAPTGGVAVSAASNDDKPMTRKELDERLAALTKESADKHMQSFNELKSLITSSMADVKSTTQLSAQQTAQQVADAEKKRTVDLEEQRRQNELQIAQQNRAAIGMHLAFDAARQQSASRMEPLQVKMYDKSGLAPESETAGLGMPSKAVVVPAAAAAPAPAPMMQRTFFGINSRAVFGMGSKDDD